MDVDDITSRHLKFAFIIVGVFLASAYFSITELRYWISGVDQVVQVLESYKFDRGSKKQRIAVVQFMLTDEDGQSQNASIEFFNSPSLPMQGDRISVTYIPGSSPLKVRPKDERDVIWPLVFFAMIGVVSFQGWKIWREVSIDTERERHSH